MKKTVIILLAMLMWIGVEAKVQTENSVKTAETTATDSINQKDLETMYINMQDELGAKEIALLQKLSPDQIMELETMKIDLKSSDLPMPSWAIVLISLAPFVMVVLIVFFNLRAKKERDEKRYQLYSKALESGTTLPEKIFFEEESKKGKLEKGAVLLAVGLGGIIWGLIDEETFFIGLGTILSLMGAAYLVVHFLKKKNSSTTDENE